MKEIPNEYKDKKSELEGSVSSDYEIIPATPEEISEVETLLDMPVEVLKNLPVTRIAEAMYILDRISDENRNHLFSQNLPKEKLDTRNSAHEYILQIGTANEAGIIHGVDTINLKE
jgi:hypothetical protein